MDLLERSFNSFDEILTYMTDLASILDPRALVFYHVTDSDKSSGEPWTKLFRYLLLVETKKARLIGQSATR